jgi:hypothetical protein
MMIIVLFWLNQSRCRYQPDKNVITSGILNDQREWCDEMTRLRRVDIDVDEIRLS